MGFLPATGSFVLFLPFSSWVLNCGDHDGSSSITLSTCSKRVVCLCPDISTAKQVQRNITDRQVTNVLLVVGSSENFPFGKDMFSLVTHHFFSWKQFSFIAGLESIIKRNREFFRVADVNSAVYVAFETHGSFLRQAGQKGLLLYSFMRLVFAGKLSLVSTVFHYETFQELFFIKYFSRAKIGLKDVFFFLKRCLAGNNIGFVFSGAPDRYNSLILIERITKTIERETGVYPGQVRCFRIGSGGSVIAEFDSLIVRIPLNKSASVFAERNYKALQLLAEMDMAFVSPEPVMQTFVEGFHVFGETKLPGISLDLEDFSEGEEKQIEELAVKIVSSSAMRVSEVDSSYLDKLLDIPFAELKQFVKADKKDLFDQISERIRVRFLHSHLPLVIVHGDYKKSNLIVQANNFAEDVGVIDWECMEIPGFPLYDLLRFLNFDVYGWEDDNKDIIPDVWEIVQMEKYPSAVLEYCEVFGIPVFLLPDLYLVFLVVYLNSYCKEEIEFNKEYRDDVLEMKLSGVMHEYLRKTDG